MGKFLLTHLMGAKRDEKKAEKENGSCMSFPTEKDLL